LLLDEPLSNLDAGLREDMRVEISQVTHELGITSVYVTHDQREALALSDAIAVVRAGQIVQFGTPEEIYRQPANAFVAGFVGYANQIAVSVDRCTVTIEGAGTLKAENLPDISGPARAFVHPGDIVLGSTSVAEPNHLAGRVVDVAFMGDRIEYVIEALPGIRLKAHFPVGSAFPRGTIVEACCRRHPWLSFPIWERSLQHSRAMPRQ
jgi:ABC-type Fe3+/spermidine/putrescine transport system ATPase subunit